MRKAVMHKRNHKLLSGSDVSEKAGKVSKPRNALDVRRLPALLKNSEKVSEAVRKNRFQIIAESVGLSSMDTD
ncbi:hypothetical protein TNCV_992091 [Trichonephila clavipes]|nr:hypothetical protein TNCV_992091 [Trichonephila clavipes]